MEKQELKRALQQHANGAMFITTTELASFLGYSNRQRVKDEYLAGLERINKRYFIPDVASRILDKREA